MDVPELNLKECESIFVRDDFYESIQAPKFHDFSSNEDPLVDADAFFRRFGGISPRPSAKPFADQNDVKVKKESTSFKPPGLPKAPLSSVALNTDDISSVPKASSAGLKKEKSAVPMLATMLTKNQEKAPPKNKMSQGVSSVSNAMLSLTVSDGKGRDPVQTPSNVKSYHASENSDPNGTSQSKRRAINSSSSKSDEEKLVDPTATSVVQPTTFIRQDANVLIDSEVAAIPRKQVTKTSKGRFLSPATRIINSASDIPDVKDRKRKPAPRNADAGVVKVNEAKSRDLKLQKKSSTPSDCDGNPGASDLGVSSSRSAGSSCGEPVRATTVKAPINHRTARRTSDNGRRRRASGAHIARQTRALTMAPKPNAVQENSGTVSVSMSSPVQFGSVLNHEQLPVADKKKSGAVRVSLNLIAVPSPDCSYSTAASSCSVHAMEISRMENEGCPNFGARGVSISGELYEKRDSAGPCVQTLSALPATATMSNGQGCHDSADLLLERMQNLQLQLDESQAVQESESNDAPEILPPSTMEEETVPRTKLLKRLLCKGPSRVAQSSDISNPNGSNSCMNMQEKRSNKRKSIELGTHRNEQRSINTSDSHNPDEQRKAKVTVESSVASFTHSQLCPSTSRSAAPTVTSVLHKKMKATCPQPFRLRTEERGALKEMEFNKKVELYMAEKEKAQGVPFQFTTISSRVMNQTGVKPPHNLSKEVKLTGKQIYHRTQARAAERALFDMKVSEKSLRADEEKQEKEKRMQLEAEEEIKKMRKQMIPHARRMPFFDLPFKPHRSTKSLTVPSSPKFQTLKSKKTIAPSTIQE
ncbi:hypothetical protein R1flu_021044 [Riccia fluitans]|uniref:TPX2 C-terminal domain-containing protein n=1 Tax=Riccia fluitans TaxID=41844 RepID=A0ABD1ZPU4_9MARC